MDLCKFEASLAYKVSPGKPENNNNKEGSISWLWFLQLTCLRTLTFSDRVPEPTVERTLSPVSAPDLHTYAVACVPTLIYVHQTQ